MTGFRRPIRIWVKGIGPWVLVGTLLWMIVLGAMVWTYGGTDGALRADSIIVLGAGIRGSKPSPVFAERIRHAVNLYHAGHAPVIIFTGGIGSGQVFSESRVGARFAEQHGVPQEDVLTEETSRTTQQNLSEALSVMQENGLHSAILVSDPLHMWRAVMMADDLGIACVASPTPSSRYRSTTARMRFLARELYFIHHYLLTGQ